jgi:hypothetical protein
MTPAADYQFGTSSQPWFNFNDAAIRIAFIISIFAALVLSIPVLAVHSADNL